MLNYDQLQVAIAAAKQRFDLLRKKYPDLDRKDHPHLKAYLVLSLPTGQTGIGSSMREILNEFPVMIIDGPVKTKALTLVTQLKRLEAEATARPETDPEKDPETKRLMKQKEQLRGEVDQLAAQLGFDENCQVEIRFKDTSFDLIWKLQADDLVDLNLTPQTKASVRIVLGTLSRFI